MVSNYNTIWYIAPHYNFNEIVNLKYNVYKSLILTSSLIICSRRLKMCKDIKKKVKDVVMHDTKTLTRHTLDFDRSHLRQSFHTNCIEPLGNDIFLFKP